MIVQRKLARVLLLIFGTVVVVCVAMHWHTRRKFVKRTVCVSNLIILRMDKVQYAEENGLTNGTQVTWEDLELIRQKRELRCPKGGDYLLNPTGENPFCTYSNDVYTYRLKGWKFQKLKWKHAIESPSIAQQTRR